MNGIQRLQMREQHLKARSKALESAIQEDWELMQEGVQNGQFLRHLATSFSLRRIYSPEMAGNSFIAGAGRIGIELARKVEALFVSALESLIQKITQKVEAWFSKNKGTEA